MLEDGYANGIQEQVLFTPHIAVSVVPAMEYRALTISRANEPITVVDGFVEVNIRRLSLRSRFPPLTVLGYVPILEDVYLYTLSLVT
jgi:hypothetical protein